MCTIPLQLREINRINKKIKKGVTSEEIHNPLDNRFSLISAGSLRWRSANTRAN